MDVSGILKYMQDNNMSEDQIMAEIDNVQINSPDGTPMVRHGLSNIKNELRSAIGTPVIEEKEEVIIPDNSLMQGFLGNNVLQADEDEYTIEPVHQPQQRSRSFGGIVDDVYTGVQRAVGSVSDALAPSLQSASNYVSSGMESVGDMYDDTMTRYNAGFAPSQGKWSNGTDRIVRPDYASNPTAHYINSAANALGAYMAARLSGADKDEALGLGLYSGADHFTNNMALDERQKQGEVYLKQGVNPVDVEKWIATGDVGYLDPTVDSNTLKNPFKVTTGYQEGDVLPDGTKVKHAGEYVSLYDPSGKTHIRTQYVKPFAAGKSSAGTGTGGSKVFASDAKLRDESYAQYETSTREARSSVNLANKLAALPDKEWSTGFAGSVDTWLADALGSQEEVDVLKAEYMGKRNQEIINSLPEGIATDTDVRIFSQGIPTAQWKKSEVEAWLRGRAKAMEYNAAYQRHKAEYIGKHGNLGSVNGKSYLQDWESSDSFNKWQKLFKQEEQESKGSPKVNDPSDPLGIRG